MSTLVLQPTSTAQWHKLVREAENAADHQLQEDLESYLVFLLMRFVNNPAIVSKIMAMEYLDGLLANGHSRHDKLRDVGDQCLLVSGFFPNIAKRRQVKVSYYVDIGRGAYLHLSNALHHNFADIYSDLSKSFVSLMDILQAMREMNSANSLLDPLQTFELWNETGSKKAFQGLKSIGNGVPVPLKNNKSH